MKKLLVVAILSTVATALACSSGPKESTPPPASSSPAASGGPKWAAIYFTENLNTGGSYSTPCIGIVATEHRKGGKGETLKWKVKKNGGEGPQGDDCNADLSMVNLRFQNPNAVSPNPAYVSNNGEITVTVSTNEADYNSSKYQKYQVYIAGAAAGPDPVIVVDCAGCGPGPAGPGE